MKKKIYRLKILTPIIVLLIITGIFFIFSRNQKEIVQAEFLNIDPKIADSVIEKMTDEQIISALFISKNHQKDTLSSTFYNSIKIFNQDSTFTPKNQIFKSINFFDTFDLLPIQKSLFYLSDSTTKEKYVKIISQLTELKKINLVFVNTNTIDTSYFKEETYNVLESLKESKIIKSIPLLQFNTEDTSAINKSKTFYDSAFALGANSLFISNSAQLNQKDIITNQGIFIAEDSIFKTAEDFLNSDIDILICDTIDKNFYEELEKAMYKNKTRQLVNKKIKKIIMAGLWCQNNDTIKSDSLSLRRKIKLLRRKIYKNSITCFNNKNNLLPIININEQLNIFYLTSSFDKKNFEKSLKKFNSKIKSTTLIPMLFEQNKIDFKTNSNLIAIVIDTIINKEYFSKFRQLDTTNNLIIINLNNKQIDNFVDLKHVIYSPSNNQISADYLAQAIYGGIEIKGHSQISISSKIPKGAGIDIPKTRLGYDIPLTENLDSNILVRIDSIVADAISKGAFPGCQVFVAKSGTVVWDKAYGYHTYSKRRRVYKTDMYDLASITKISATTLAAMKLYEQGKLPLDKPIGKYFKDTKINYTRIKPDTSIMIDTLNILQDSSWKKQIVEKDTIWLDDTLIQTIDTVIYKLTPQNNIFKVTPRDLLRHESGIQPVLPILEYMLLTPADFKNLRDYYNSNQIDSLAETKKQMREKYYSHTYIKDSATIKVAQGFYLKNQYLDSLWFNTKQLPVAKKVYQYSDVNMIILQITIDSINRKPINIYTSKKFYNPLGLKFTSFLPYKYYSKKYIVPTENDKYWRKQLLQGYVHDPSAAVMGGVAGNAGLFSNAEGLGVLFQMILNGGTYGGKRYLLKKTIRMFTQTQPDSHRGLGFDKWSKRQIIAPQASHNTYGHTGFTGGCVWVDPDNEIVFVFLSNRVHPSAKNQRINRLKVRQKVHQTVYDAIINDN